MNHLLSVRKVGYVGQEYYEMHFPASVMTVSDPHDMKVLDELKREVKFMNARRREGDKEVDEVNYIQWYLNEYGWVLPSERR